jgi:hypothetical protein
MISDRTLRQIAAEIRADWKQVSEYAIQQLDGMEEAGRLEGRFGIETGADAVRGFLINAHHWRGETARRIKGELRAMLKARYGD